MSADRTRITLTIADFTFENGKMSGHVSLFTTEHDKTTTVEYVIGSKKKRRTTRKGDSIAG